MRAVLVQVVQVGATRRADRATWAERVAHQDLLQQMHDVELELATLPPSSLSRRGVIRSLTGMRYPLEGLSKQDFALMRSEPGKLIVTNYRAWWSPASNSACKRQPQLFGCFRIQISVSFRLCLVLILFVCLLRTFDVSCSVFDWIETLNDIDWNDEFV